MSGQYQKKNMQNGLWKMKNDTPLISIIIPVYNGEHYIENCIHSVLKQNYKDYEIVIIDDGSTDTTREKCMVLAELYSQLQYYFQNNSGAGAARNKGIEVCKGEYVAFVDVDDYIHPTYLEELYGLIVKYKVKMSCCSYIKGSSDDTEEFLKICSTRQIKLLNRNQALKSMFYRKEIMGYPYLKLISKELIGKKRFPVDMRLGEDFIFIYELLRETDQVAYISKPLYLYIQNQEGITHTLRLEDMKALWNQMIQIVLPEMSVESKEFEKAVISKLFILACDFLVRLKKNGEDDFREELFLFMQNNRVCVAMDSENKRSIRLLGSMCCISVHLVVEVAYLYVVLYKKLHWNMKKAL